MTVTAAVFVLSFAAVALFARLFGGITGEYRDVFGFFTEPQPAV